MSLVRRETLWSPHDVHEVEAILESSFRGRVGDGSFKLNALGRRTKNSWRPRLIGTFEAGDTGTLLHVSYPMHPFVLIFTLLHGIPFMGLSWLMGFAFWRMGVVEMSNELRDAVSMGGEGVDALKAAEGQVSDPTQAGAAAGAPGSLRPTVSLNGVSFLVGGEADKRLVVDRAGMTLTWRDRLVPWDEVERVDLDPLERLRIVTHDEEVVRVGLQAAHEEDRIWLAVFLQTRNERGSGSAEERAMAQRERERLTALVPEPDGRGG